MSKILNINEINDKIEAIVEGVGRRIPEDYNISYEYVTKTNKELDAIAISSDNEIGICVYPDFSLPVEEIIDYVVTQFENSNLSQMKFDLDDFKFTLKLLRIKGNETFLQDAVWESESDLAKVLYKASNDGQMSFKVTKTFLDNLGISESEAWEEAYKNCRKTATVNSLEDAIHSMFSFAEPKNLLDMDLNNKPDCFVSDKLYIVSNKSRYLGATSVLLPDVQEMLAAVFPNGYIVIPSSIHEVLISDISVCSSAEFTEMIQSVNATEVAEEEVLSDHPYIIHEGHLNSFI